MKVTKRNDTICCECYNIVGDMVRVDFEDLSIDICSDCLRDLVRVVKKVIKLTPDKNKTGTLRLPKKKKPKPEYVIKKIVTLIDFIELAKELGVSEKSIKSETFLAVHKLLPISDFEVIKILESCKRHDPNKPIPYMLSIIINGRKNNERTTH